MVAFNKGGIKAGRPDLNKNSLYSSNDEKQSHKENATNRAFPETVKT
jgi:hypothetical protein